MNTVLTAIIETDTSYNKSATRYLYKTHPELWEKIVESTSFLPNTAKAKQRCWHVLNDIYSRPICPVTGEYVHWHENQYFKTIDRHARIKHLHSQGVYANSHCEEFNEKRKAGNLKAVANGRKYRDKDTYTVEQRRKTVDTWLQKYGVENVFQLDWVKEKSKDTLLQKYGVICAANIPELKLRRKNAQLQKIKETAGEKQLRKIYYCLVGIVTRQTWRDHALQIIAGGVDRSVDNSLDHIYSVQQGFRDNIPPYIIGHYSNLRILQSSINSSKGMRCDKSKGDLFADFFAAVNSK